ncbi:hypothetical protein [Geothrix sp. 21YS21S-4]|uniref:hypothetical protein n=1 Tax=Geothrix sp. 21YS21S-4 TaxID=3068889 RepID=UPI0027BA47BC|nr:hypothetical protein [Geothrix sp. 21YS21S-4]
MSTQAFDSARDHRITREEASELVKAFQSKAKTDEHRASAFNRSAFEQLLAQPNAAGIRIYRAAHKDGSPTMVMVAVDQAGQDLVGGEAIFIQNGTDCPPFCAAKNWI